MTTTREETVRRGDGPRRSAWRSIAEYASWKFVGKELGLAVIAALLSLVIGIVALRINPEDLGLRWGAGGADQVLHYTIFSSALDTFPFFPNAHLGFPTDQNLFFAPLFDVWSASFVWVISAFVPNGIWALNLYNVASFFAVGFTSLLFFRALKVRRVIALVFGVLFAVVPYHIYQMAIGHPFLSNYWAVPLTGILILMAAGDRTNPFAGWIGRAHSRRMALSRRLIPIIVLGAAVGWTQSYYFIFAALLVGGIWVVNVVTSAIQGRRWRDLLWPTVTTGTLFVLIGIQLAVLSLNFGDRYAKYFGARTFIDSELYGGKFMDLILPSVDSGWSKLAQYSSSYHSASPILTTSEASATALIASLAIIFSFGLVLVRIFWRPAADGRSPSAFSRFVSDDRTVVLLAAFLGAFLFFIASGLGTALAYTVSPEIRAWSRMSIVVSMLALGVLAVFLNSLVKKNWVLIATLVVITVVALVDQVRSIGVNRPIEATSDVALEQFTAAAETLLPDNCGVVILPLKGFPETGQIGQMGDYDEALPYVYAHDDDLRWSYGSVQGTKDADFWAQVRSASQFEAALQSSKACAILVDSYAYSDAPGAWKEWVSAAGDDPSTPALVSTDPSQRYLLFTLKQ